MWICSICLNYKRGDKYTPKCTCTQIHIYRGSIRQFRTMALHFSQLKIYKKYLIQLFKKFYVNFESGFKYNIGEGNHSPCFTHTVI